MINISGKPIGPKSAYCKLMGGSVQPLVAAMSLILALTSTTSGAVPSITQAQQPVYSTRVTQVEVYATVTDAEGRAVKGLRAEDFTVLEDNVEQSITAFLGGDFPAAVALALDRSFSMKGTPLTMARTAARVFVGSLKPEDRVMLISISGEVEVLAPLSTERQPLLDALAKVDPWGTTSLNDAIIRSLDLLEGETGRRAIVVLSDGEDRYSTAKDVDVLNRARRSDVLVYPIAIGRDLPTFFPELATLTGGRSFHLRDARDLQTTLQAIATDLGAQYLLGYAPAPRETGDDGWRSITVRVNRPGVTVRARSGYSPR
jgi:Ca-activated chloride channel family protein